MRKIDYIISEKFEGRTVYQYLRGEAGISLSLVRSLKRTEHGIELNGEHIRTVDLLKTGDVLSVTIPEQSTVTRPSDTEIDVVFEDDDILVVNKSPFLPIHESHNHQGDTLQNAVCAYMQKKGKNVSFRAIGRLDKGTSGLVVCALNRHVAHRLSGEIKKEYLAIPTGEYAEPGTIDAPIFRPDPMKTFRTVDEKGDRAVTHYTPLCTGNGLSLLAVKLETGRTHQIRVHFRHLGTPLYGDTMYGTAAPDITHQCLHCHRVEFTHPLTNEKIICEAPMPEDMQRIFLNFQC